MFPIPFVFFKHLMQMSLSLLAKHFASLSALPLELVEATGLEEHFSMKKAVRLS